MTNLIVALDNNVTITKRVSNNAVTMQSLRYNELASKLNNEVEIEVNYCFGQAKRRTNLLAKLGFELKQTIFYNDDAPYSAIKQVWARA